MSLLKDYYEIVGIIPSHNPTVPGLIKDVPLLWSDEGVQCDLKLSLQYDTFLTDVRNSYNLHTGLLPEWGGCDILYHTLKERVREQGLTFHKITDQLDYGEIVSQVTYPVFDSDTVLNLYERVLMLAPMFTLSSLRLLNNIQSKVQLCPVVRPRSFKRGRVLGEDKEVYASLGALLRERFSDVQ